MDAFVYAITKALRAAFHNDYLAVFVLSTIPTIEVKGAIPAGIGMGLDPWTVCAVSVLSSLAVAPLILFCLKPLLNWLKGNKVFGKFADGVEGVFEEKARKTVVSKSECEKDADSEKCENDALKRKKNETSLNPKDNGKYEVGKYGIEKLNGNKGKKDYLKMLSLFLFVALPLPMTGVWTGCGVAAFMQKKYRYSVIPIVLGSAVQGVIFTLISISSPSAGGWAMLGAALLALISVAAFAVKILAEKRRKKA